MNKSPFKIAVCDDSAADSGYALKLLDLWAQNAQTAIKTETFPSAQSFLFRHSEDKSFDVLLLDIEMDGMDGVSLAENIRKTDSDLKIIFITGYPEFVSRGYDVGALHYLLKPITAEKLFPVLDRALLATQKQSSYVLLKNENGSFRIDTSKIVCAEAFSHSLHVTTLDGEFDISKTLSEFASELGKNFVRSHRSYLVGLAHIARLSKNDITLDNGKTIPISRNSAAEVHRAFVNYYTGDKLENI